MKMMKIIKMKVNNRTFFIYLAKIYMKIHKYFISRLYKRNV
uniref:Uncharacterized protein n=1 Tax=viral metagenome TaxID=1070528 RepID=A0A6C0LQ56_9ZZZZ